MDDQVREIITQRQTSQGRYVSGVWWIIGVLMAPSGLAGGLWWILPSAALIITGSTMLWWASG